MTDHTQIPKGPDTRPAITGFILGAVALLVILTSIVKLTNAHFEGEKGPEAAATQPK
jgi:hypothetical protein